MSNFRRDERGIGHLLVIVLAVVVLAAVVGVGLKVAHKNKTPTLTTSNSAAKLSTSTSSASESSSCLSTYHDAHICNFASNSLSFDKTAYTATITEAQSGTTSSLTLKNDGKGNTELTTTGSGETLNAITLDGNSYIQSGGSGTWVEYPTGATDPTPDPTSSMDIGVGSSGTSFKALGTASCGSLECYKYQVTDSASPGATQYVFFDTSSYKLREWQYTDTSGNTTDMTVTYTPVNITKPSPVQQFSTSL